MAREDFAFLHPLRVRWAEVDAQGVVFNPHYLMYFDVAITEYWRALGYPYPHELARHGADIYVVKAGVEYRASAVYDDQLEIGMRCARIGRSSLVFRPEVLRGESVLASGELVYVNVAAESKQPAPVPAFLREAITAFERVAPES